MNDSNDQRRQVHSLAWKLVLSTADIAGVLNELQLTELDPVDAAWLTASSGALFASWQEVEQMREMVSAGDLKPLHDVNAAIREAA